MATEKRGVQQIKTMGGIVDGRRIRTSAGALLELSMLEMEKQRLMKEMKRAEQRCLEIRGRVTEIETKQVRLQRFVDKPISETQANQALAATPFPVHTAPTDRLKRRALAY
jgi:predicted nuclease with TOPRIM domain